MKKILLSVFVLTGMAAGLSAQTNQSAARMTTKPAMVKPAVITPVNKPVSTVKTTAMVKPASVKPVTTIKPATTGVKPMAVTTTAPLKKDGTPDKRFKASQKLKKDGTPDRRFKSNKKG
jgi:hypothetical protein